MIHSRSQHAFTLIEVSIALVIIGLIIGGVLIGKDLIEAAKTRSIIAQVEEVRTAISTFKLKYSSMPGDVESAKADALGFEPRSGDIGSGDGNGIVETCTAGGENDDFTKDYLGCENVLIWRDLSDAGFIGSELTVGSDALATSLTAADIKDYLPSLRAKRDTYMYFFSKVERMTFPIVEDPENLLGLAGYSGTTAAGVVMQTTTITPYMAFAIDSKLDDGKPIYGNVRASTTRTNGFNDQEVNFTKTCWYPPVFDYATGLTNTGVPNPNRDKPVCAMLFIK